jgi:hypothetical protein
MGDGYIKQGNKNHPLVITLKHENELTGRKETYEIPDGSTARIKITVDAETVLVLDEEVTILNQVNYPGKVQYLLDETFTENVNTYDVEIKLTLPDGSVRKFPGSGEETFSTLHVLPSKGGS